MHRLRQQIREIRTGAATGSDGIAMRLPLSKYLLRTEIFKDGVVGYGNGSCQNVIADRRLSASASVQVQVVDCVAAKRMTNIDREIVVG